jgi:hypothetical protein
MTTTENTPTAARLTSKLVANGACLEFGGSRSEDGYGTIRYQGRMQKAHRVAWQLAHGPIPKGLLVCHRCDNPPCCNVAHLFLGTVADNNRDRHAKGRTKNLDIGQAIRHEQLRSVTHCPKGHPYAGDNLRTRPSGNRRCRECYRLAAAAYVAANRDAVNARKRARRAMGARG